MKIGRIFGLENSRMAKKFFSKYMELKGRKYHGIYERKILGSTMLLDLDNDPILAKSLVEDGLYSYTVTSSCYHEIKPDMIIIDVGANIGYVTFLAASRCGEYGSVISFEPGFDSCNLMKKSLKLNSYKNIEILNKGVAEKTKKGKLFLSPTASVDNQILEGIENRNSIDIQIVSIDDFVLERNIVPDFIKIDVQGAEYFVFDGMIKLLQTNESLKLLVEFSPRKQKEKMDMFLDLLNKMKNLGFKIYYLHEPKKEIDFKSFLVYENEIKSEITNLKNLEFSRYDEIDLLFIRT
jgi:FkbM family methyltransferase